ncbi:hypothetical protein RB623_01390 [Mesorhizobium sp. LHD-90]|uniref:DUF6958 family protein n=1 Tax=Mesorhizobium sp. LHD-90 TaxID=3071414 RepID=UPI0027E07592|nr:hypothetical protein [Mesorhizobium sp. LHD-90]MDQ6432704.1 hypothetical protein [Mesorhizobium sp. LHD-90]
MIGREEREKMLRAHSIGPKMIAFLEEISVERLIELKGADAEMLAMRIDVALGRKHMNRLGVAALRNLIDLAEREAGPPGSGKPAGPSRSDRRRRVLEREAAGGRPARQEETMKKVMLENINHPGSTQPADAAKYEAMRNAYLTVLPAEKPGLTVAEVGQRVVAHLPQDLFPGGATSGWWAKAVQLDLEAKGIVARSKTSPIRLHRIR